MLRKIFKILFFLIIFLLSLEACLRLSGKIYYYFQTADLDPDSFHIVALGESTTQGGAAFGKQFSYPGQLEISLASKCKRPVQVINLGMAGVRTRDILGSLPENIKKYKPNLVITMMGINDVERYYVDTKLDSPWYVKFVDESHLNKLRVWILTVWRDLKQRNEPNVIAPNDTPNEILAKIRAGDSLDSLSFATHFTAAALRSGDEDGAIKLHEEVLKIRPDHGWANAGLGWIYFKLKHVYPRAEFFYQKAIASNPLDPADRNWFRMRLAELYAETKQLEKLQAVGDEVMAADRPAIFNCIFLANLYIQTGLWEKAIAILRRASERDPDNQTILALLLHAYSKTNDTDAYQVQSKKRDSILSKMELGTAINYRKIVETLIEKKIPVLAMQYPMRSDENLKNLLRDYIENSDVVVLSNKDAFTEALRTQRYDDLFIDRFGGDFGHTTMKGDELIASNAAQTLLEKFPQLRNWCNSN